MKKFNLSFVGFGIALSLIGILATTTAAANFQLTDSALQDCKEHPKRTAPCRKPPTTRSPLKKIIKPIYTFIFRSRTKGDPDRDSFCKQFVTDKGCATNFKVRCAQMQEGNITTCSLILTNLENIQKQNVDSMSKDDVNKYIEYITGLTVSNTKPEKGAIVNTTDLASLLEKLKARKASIDKYADDCDADLKKQCTEPNYNPDGTPDIPSRCASGYVHIQYLDKNWKFCPWNAFRPGRNAGDNTGRYNYDCTNRRLFGGCSVNSF